jgi:alkylmercury lyase
MDSNRDRFGGVEATAAATTVEELADAIAAASVAGIDDPGRRIAVSLYELLAEGEPVTPANLAARAGVAEAVAVETLDGWPGVFHDEEGRVVGFWGLAIPEMGHRFHAEGGKPIYAWCALDPFLIVPVVGRSARVESTDPVTGETITMTVTPDGVEDVSPASAVVSFLVPNKPFDQDIIQSFCHYVLNFASQASAEQWASQRDGIVLLPVADAFQVGLRAWRRLGSPAGTRQ